MDDLVKVITDYVVREYVEAGDDTPVTPDTPLITGGIVDSFSLVSLKRFLEKTYAITIPDAEATPAAFNTVHSIAELVERVRARATAGARG